ncbi:MAG: hypothetical protein Q8922_15350 [Bacteroidota bacterium]|nr:hypothetical protein [Bacteroidota bacterium]MDP4232633.1 hypothetical protein [Bacteroidota bacterium]MDP4243885.1 hypothetical protein [Bacteroidota bacterium]MDP4289293.1 hypothetical protein [Bacteroidota bacterium]
MASILLLALTSAPAARPQWVDTKGPRDGPYGVTVYALAVSGTNLFAGTLGVGIVWRRPLRNSEIAMFHTSLRSKIRFKVTPIPSPNPLPSLSRRRRAAMRMSQS